MAAHWARGLCRAGPVDCRGGLPRRAWSDDLGLKVDCYAAAGISAYLIADRKHDEVLLYTDPADGKYPDPQRFKRGQTVPVPESVGVTLDLSVDTLLNGDD